MEGRKQFGLDKPVRHIIRLLLFGKLNQSTNSETAMLSQTCGSPYTLRELIIPLQCENMGKEFDMQKQRKENLI